MVSLPENMVILVPVVVERTSSKTCAGQGKYSYCHPAKGFNPNWFAVIRVEKMNCGISVALSMVPGPLRLEQGLHVQRTSVALSSHPHSTYLCTAIGVLPD